MLKSSNQEYFFETDASQAKREQRAGKSSNKFGNPIVLKSKILAAVVDPSAPSSAVFVAESAGSVRRVDVDTGATTPSFRGPMAPVTCLTTGAGRGGASHVFAGCWDMTVWSWALAPSSSSSGPSTRYEGGHTDFVKAVVCASVSSRDGGGGTATTTHHLLISGGADRRIVVWDAASGARLHTLQDGGAGGVGDARMLAVQCLAVEPSPMAAGRMGGAGRSGGRSFAMVVSGSSDPALRRWKVGATEARQVAFGEAMSDGGDDKVDGSKKGSAGGNMRMTIAAHGTSIYQVAFDAYDDGDDDEEEGDEVGVNDVPSLWTASADGTAKRLSPSRKAGDPLTVVETLGPGVSVGGSVTDGKADYVRAVAPTRDWIVTGGRDEHVRMWRRDDGDDDDDGGGTGADRAPAFVLEGHYDEVTDLVVLRGGAGAGAGAVERVVSVSIDGTVRTWPLREPELQRAVAAQEDARKKAREGGAAEEDEDGGEQDGDKGQEGGGLTAEEEAELAALMDDDDD